jgi:hypothetical protein
MICIRVRGTARPEYAQALGVPNREYIFAGG